MLETPVKASPSVQWLIRFSEIFEVMEADIFRALDAEPLKKLGNGYWLIRIADPATLRGSPAAKFLRWNLPVHHSWPCRPADIDGFVEKAAQALSRKFRALLPQTVLAGAIDSGSSNRYYRTLASNLRGRTLQLFPSECGAIRDASDQVSQAPTLFCLVGKDGLVAGLQSPALSNGFHPGGTKYISQQAPSTISRAGAKIVEALHHLRLKRPPPAAGSHWLELGASPGGMTAELLSRGYLVTAVDRAPLDQRLDHVTGLKTVLADAATYHADPGQVYDAILSDMNGDARASIAHVIRLARYLRLAGLVVFTLKMPGVNSLAAANQLEEAVVALAATAGLRILSRTHLTYNRHEFTLFFEQMSAPDAANKHVRKRPD